MTVLVKAIVDSIVNVDLYATYSIPFSLIIAYTVFYYNKRFRSPLASAPLATADHFLVKYFGLVPPPNDAEKTDTLSQFLIRVGQDVKQSPVSVCWSVTGTPLVLVNSPKACRDILIDGQAKNKVKGQEPNIQRGNLIRLIQNHVFGGTNINNAIGEVSLFHSTLSFLSISSLTKKNQNRPGAGVDIFSYHLSNPNSLFPN